MFGKTISRLKKKRPSVSQYSNGGLSTETIIEDDLEPVKATPSNSSAVSSSRPSTPVKPLLAAAPAIVSEPRPKTATPPTPVIVASSRPTKIPTVTKVVEVMAPASVVAQSNGVTASSKKMAKATTLSIKVTQAEDASQDSSSSETENVVSRTTVSTVVQTDSNAVSREEILVGGPESCWRGYDAPALEQTDLVSYLNTIADERLMHMPRKGSDWDRVLRTAQFFGLQIWRFGEKVGKFAPLSREAASGALASCRMLLDIGHQQAAALLPGFMVLYELGLLVSQITQIPGIFESDRTVKDDISRLYGELVHLTRNVAKYYRRNISGLGRYEQPTRLDLDAEFGEYIESIWTSKAALYERMWRQSMGKQSYALGPAELRARLNDDKTQFRHALYAELSEDLERAEDTCEWVKADLADFLQSGDKFLSVTGGPGSGKTVLADWIEERLQRPLLGTTYSVLLYTFPSDDHESASVLGFLKGVLFQLLERSVGNMKLYQSLVSAFSAGEQPREALETALWKALQVGLNTFKRSEEPIVLLLDGLDEVAGGQQSAVTGFLQALRQHVTAVKSVRIITFARHERAIAGARKIVMTAEEIAPDIRSFLRQTLARSSLFMELAPATREKTIDGLAQKAGSSFLWARLAGSYLVQYYGRKSEQKQQQQTGGAGADELIKVAAGLSGSLDDVLQLLVARLDLKGDSDLARMLVFLAVSDGVLAETDVAQLLSVHVTEQRSTAEAVDVAQLVSHTVPDLVLVRDGHVRFKSSLIRQHMQQRQLGRALPATREAHTMMVLHLLLYSRLSVRSAAYGEPTVEEMDDVVARRLMAANPLLPLVMARWLTHFRASSMIQGGELALLHDFRAVFPDTAVFALLEHHVWSRSLGSSDEVIAWLTLSLRIREKLFTDRNSVSVLQSLIVLGRTHLAAGHVVDGARYLYRAAILGRTVLSTYSTLVIACTDLFLDATSSMVFTTRTDIFEYREELIRFKIEHTNYRYGTYSDRVIVWYESLAAMYVATNEVDHIRGAYKELQEINVKIFGSGSREARKVVEAMSDVKIQREGEERTAIPGIGKTLIDIATFFDDKDVLRVPVGLEAARSFELEEKWQLAERVYVRLWQWVSGMTQTSAVASLVDMHAAKLQVSLAYSTFLRRQKRTEEAANILIVLWTEYETYKFESTEMIGYIHDVAVQFKELGLLVISASILSKVWSWCQMENRTEDEVARSTTTLVTEVVREITETTVTTKVTTMQTTEETETVVHELFHRELQRCKDRSTLDTTFFSSAAALVNTHVARGRWEEAEMAIRRSLEVTWPEVLQDNGEPIKLSPTFARETVQLSKDLATGYSRQRQFDRAEKVHLRVYEAAMASLSPEDDLFVEVLSGLVGFYEAHHRHEAVIGLYIGLVQRYKASLGSAHALTVRALYTLAGQYELLGRREAYGCYGEIAGTLNKGLDHVHPDAFTATVALVRHWRAEKRWSELTVVASQLWKTFVIQRKESISYEGFTEEVAALAYEAHVTSLEHQAAPADNALMYRTAVEYRDRATDVFGSSSSVVGEALLALAEVAERSEQHQLEALAIYEEVLTRHKTTRTTTTVLTETTVHTVRRRLSQLYVTVISSGSKKMSGAVTATTIERAVAVSIETYTQMQAEYGVWHEATLKQLHHVIVVLQRSGTAEAQVRVRRIVESAVVDIVSCHGVVSMQLFEAATRLAAVFVSTGLVTLGRDLLSQLRLLLVFGSTLPASMTKTTTIKLPADIHSRVVFLFVAAFERQLSETRETKTVVSSASFSELLSSLLCEAFLHDEYRTAVATGVGIELLLQHGARLRRFWVDDSKVELVRLLDGQLFPLFVRAYAEPIKAAAVAEEHVVLFYEALLAELGRDRAHASFSAAAASAGNAEVRTLLESGRQKQALEVGRLAFVFSASQGYYGAESAGIGYGYDLASMLASVGVQLPTTDASTKETTTQLLLLSRAVTAEIFTVLEAQKVDLAALEVHDVAALVRLLAAQADYGRLQSMLLRLWQSREVRRSWKPATVLSIGFALVHAYVGDGHSHLDRAVDLADLLWYNLRRSRGWLDPDALAAGQLLASLYVEAGRIADALGLYENVLRQIEAAASGVHSAATTTNAAEDAQGDRKALAAHACHQLELLRAAHARLGRWVKPKKEYQDLYDHLRSTLGLQTQLALPFDKWAAAAMSGSAASKAALPGCYVRSTDLVIVDQVRSGDLAVPK